MTVFYLGSHRPRWLEDPFSPPLFISAHTLAAYRRRGDDFPKAQARYAIDSGGFTELRDHGTWTTDPDTYGGMIYRFIDDIGRPPDFVSPQDWMCEPVVIAGGVLNGQRYVGTGLTVALHQELTVENLVYLRAEFPHVPWLPVLQGWTVDEYLSHADQYAAAGIDLADEPLVGLGSVCRRASTAAIGALISVFHGRGYRLHVFGGKTDALRAFGHMVASADSQGWSFRARIENIRLEGCEHRGPCNNCRRYALRWRAGVLDALDAPKQLSLDVFGLAA